MVEITGGARGKVNVPVKGSKRMLAGPVAQGIKMTGRIRCHVDKVEGAGLLPSDEHARK